MTVFLSFFVAYLIGTVAAREANIDANRIRLLPQENSYSASSREHRRSLAEHNQQQTNDYVDRSSRFNSQPPQPLQVHLPSRDTKSTNTPLSVHQPKEDPRLFYQSNAYLEEINGQNVNKDVTYIYPGKEVNRANKETRRKFMSLRMQDRNHNSIRNGANICVKCPHDRSLVARAGTDRVILQTPRLISCSGHRAPKTVRFVHMHGPKFGSLIQRGSHLIIGRIMYKNKSIHLCKMQVHVITPSCVTPNNLKYHCSGQNCTFACRNPDLELQGQSTLQCGSDMKWIGELPHCKAKLCIAPSKLPKEQLEHITKISCQAPDENFPADSATGYPESSKCRIRCNKGWRWFPRAVSICRHGLWTIPLDCHKITKRKTIKFRKS